MLTSSVQIKNFLRQFTIDEIQRPLSLHQQEQLAQHLLTSIQRLDDEEGKLPDHLEEFKRIYEGPHHVEAKLPILSQLTPRTKKMIAVIPKPNEAEMAQVRAIERGTRHQVGRPFYQKLNEGRNPMNKLKEEDDPTLLDPSRMEPLIPRNTQPTTVKNKAMSYLDSIEQYKRKQAEQQDKIDLLFGNQRTISTSSSAQSVVEHNKMKRQGSGVLSSQTVNLGYGSSSGGEEPMTHTPSSSSAKYEALSNRSPSPPLHRASSAVSVSAVDKTAATDRRSSANIASAISNPISSIGSLLRRSPNDATSSSTEVLQVKQNEIRKQHQSFLEDFTVRVYEEMGVDLNSSFNRLRKYRRNLEIMLYHFYRFHLNNALRRWKERTSLSREFLRQQAAWTIYRAFRYNHLFSALKVRFTRRYHEKVLKEKRAMILEAFRNDTASRITRCLRKFGEKKRLRERMKLSQAVRRVQRLYRGWIGRKIAQLRLVEKKRKEKAAIMIQCLCRRRLAIRKVSLLQKLSHVASWVHAMETFPTNYRLRALQQTSAAFIIKAYRSYRIKKKLYKLVYYNRFARAIIIQRYYRGFRERKAYLQHLEEKYREERMKNKNAVIIQKYVRRFLAELALDRLYEAKDNRQIELYNQKLLLLAQGDGCLTFFKRYLHRWRYWHPFSKEKVYEKKALLIQKVYRGYHGRQRAYLLKIMQTVEKVQAAQLKRYRAVVRIQKHWRGYQTRVRLHQRHRASKAVVIQCLYRCHNARKRFNFLKLLNRRAAFLTANVRRMIKRHHFHLRYKRQQYLLQAAIPIQCFFRRCKARRIRDRLLKEMRTQREYNLINHIHFIHLLASVQLQILIDTIPKAIQHRYYVVSGVDCPCLGPIQALFVLGICGNYNRSDQQTLATNKLENASLVKFLNKIDGMTEKEGTERVKNSFTNGICNYPEGDAKESIYLHPSTLHQAFMTEVLLGYIPLLEVQHKLSTIEIDIIFSRSKSSRNVTHKLTYKEFLNAAQLIADAHYSKAEEIFEQEEIGQQAEEGVSEGQLSVGVDAGGQMERAALEEGGPSSASIATESQQDELRTEGEVMEAEEEVKDELLEAVKEIYDDRQPFHLKKFLSANIQAINKKSGFFHPDRMRADPDVVRQDPRLALFIRWLAYFREEEFVQKVLSWLDLESRARLGLLVIPFQCLVRKRQARFRFQRRFKEKEEEDRQDGILKNVVKMQSIVRGFIWRRRVIKLAQRTLRKYVPTLSDPYFFHPITKVKSRERPKVLKGHDCYTLALPESGLENVVRCYNCQYREAVLNCHQCEDSMCRVCFDSLHCKGQRSKHTYSMIPHCGYCLFQMATKSCVTCVVRSSPPGSNTLQSSLPPSQRGYYCDTCFLYEHDSFQHQLEEQPHLRNQLKTLFQVCKEAYLVANYLHQRISTHHHYEMLTQPCEECHLLSASWRCFDCQQVYCHRCLITLHSFHQQFARHSMELLPYYTHSMHQSFRKDVARQVFLKQLERVQHRARIEREEYEVYCATILQSWWRMIYGGRIGRRHMKKRRQLLRRAYRLRKKENLEIRSTWGYRFWTSWGRGPELVSDTREERVLNVLPWYRRPIAKTFIMANIEDWGWYQLSSSSSTSISSSSTRKGNPRKGFEVGSIEELRDQARFGGYHMPGRVIVQVAERTFTTTQDLRDFLHPGELVRIRNRIFGVITVDQDSIKVNRLWREEHSPRQLEEGKRSSNSSRRREEIGEILYRLPTYRNEPQRFYFRMRYRAYDLTIGNPMTQLVFYLYRLYSLRMMAFSLYMSHLNKKNKHREEAVQWKQRAIKYMEAARWAASYASTGDAFRNLSIVTKEEAYERAEKAKQSLKRIEEKKSMKKKRKRKGDGEEEEDDEEEGQAVGGSRPGSKQSKKSRKNGKGGDMDAEFSGKEKSKPSSRSSSRRSRTSRLRSSRVAATTSDSSPASPLTTTEKSGSRRGTSLFPGMLVNSRSNSGKKQSRRGRQKPPKAKAPWYASAEQIAQRKAREDRMTMQELANEAPEWKECIDVMTENIYYLNVNTNEMMTTVPRAVQSKRQLEFENSKNKKAFDEARLRIATLEKVTKNRLLLTGGRKR
eukprot:gene8917-9836_t